jgi:glycosyltransferase involved in cell wall biosynthesis
MSGARPRLCLVTTSPIVVQFFLVPHLRALSQRFETTLVANSDCTYLFDSHCSDVRMTLVPVEREIAPLRDAMALARLTALFRRERFDAVITIAPKAGLLGQLAARAARVPYRCHIFQGEVWASRQGFMRALLRVTDKIVAAASSETLVVSASERAFLIGEGILAADRSMVLGRGSVCGVDTGRFAPNAASRKRIRGGLGLPDDATLLLFLGRLHRDKGVLDLVAAWTKLAINNPNLHLALVGPDEGALVARVMEMAGEIAGPDLRSQLHVADNTREPEAWLAAADILSLPSYREGFGNVIIEAGATGLPVIVSRIYGTVDAFVEGTTGLGHAPGDRDALQACIARLVGDRSLCQSFGQAGRAIAARDFQQSHVVQLYADHFYGRVTSQRKADVDHDTRPA